jgi:hypothetical protein
MIRRDLLKGFLTGVAAAVMGRSAKSDIAPHSLPRTEPVKVLDPGIEVKRKPFRMLRCVRFNFAGSPKCVNMGYAAIRTKDGKERLLLSCSTPTECVSNVLGDSVILAEDEDIIAYTYDGDRRVPVSYDVLFEDFNERGQSSYYHRTVCV